MTVIASLSMQNFTATFRRSRFLWAGITLVTVLWLVLQAFSGGTRHSLLKSATTLVTGHINVAGFYKSNPSDVAAVIENADAVEQMLRQNRPALKRFMRRYRGWGKAISDLDSLQTGMIGVTIEDEPELFSLLSSSRRSSETGSLARLKEKNVVVLFEEQARRLSVDVGDKITIRSETFGGRANTIDAEIIYIAKDLGVLSNFSMIVPNELLRALYQLQENTTGVFHLILDDIEDSSELSVKIRSELVTHGHLLLPPSSDPFFLKLQDLSNESWLGQKLDVTIWNEEVSYLTWILTSLSSLNAILTTIMILLIAIGILNTLWISVRRRTSEVGTLRAIGMSKSRVLRMFLYESFWLGLVGTLSGALIATLTCWALEYASIQVPNEALHAILMSDVLHFHLSALDVLRTTILITAIVVLSALPPAFRATQIPPITAIHRTD